MKNKTILATAFVLFAVLFALTDAWRGNYHTVTRARYQNVRYCACWYFWWGCSYWRSYWMTNYYKEETCEPGWRHNGDRNCNIPVCRPRCQNGGNCTNPNTCKCPSWSSGIGCASLTCSYKRPCYPGNCKDGSTCECEPGFVSNDVNDGCITFNSSASELRPVVGKSNVTLSHIRRFDNKVDFMFTLEGLEEKEPGKKEIIWSNQKRFNNLRFEYDTTFLPPENLPERPNYVHESRIGIVESVIEANVSKVARNKGPIRDPGSFKTYPCPGFRKDRPEEEVASCVIDDDQFTTLIEHGDWLNIKFKSTSGGFQQLVNTDEGSSNYARKYYNGLQDAREVQFNFDFDAPKHCTEKSSRECGPDPSILRIENEFTKNPIEMYWSGWEDELSGVWEYYVEVFELSPNIYGKLVEAEPLKPVYSKTVSHRKILSYPRYTPKDPAMYSVLLETRDYANNSRISRRLVLFDDQSDITLNKTSQLYVSSAVAETGYKWQTAVQEGQDVNIDVVWSNHFINEMIEGNKWLNPVDPYPIQFKEIQDDGVLYSQKFVNDSLDDHEGKRTLEPIRNFHGIVKFEWAKELTLNEDVPAEGWKTVKPLKENTSLSLKLSGGSTVRIWVRATDVMGNVKTDNTFVTFDMTEPKLSKSRQEGHKFEPNIEKSIYNYTSRIRFTSKDDESGVHKIGFSIQVKSDDNQQPRTIYEGFAPAAMSEDTENPFCVLVENKCFLPKQTLYLDNCWFLVSKGELESSTASVEVTAYNQALLNSSTVFDVGKVKNLQGLEEYSGPENIRIESVTSTGFRVAWDLPEKISCYGSAKIVLVLFRKQAGKEKTKVHTYNTRGTDKFFDIYGLDAVTDYQIDFGLNSPNVQDTVVSLQEKTLALTERKDNIDVIIAASVSILAIIIIAVVIMVVLVRKGYIHPGERAQNVRRAVTQKVRQSFYSNEPRQGGSQSRNVAYDNRQSDLYIYGGMDMDTPQIWHLDRNDVTFETLIKSGHFANIYKARIRRRGKGSGDVVVAKTLKERFTSEDELLMKAKINFTGGNVGEHPNVLKFIGAVVHDDAMGPFIIYEYCQNGTLKDYLVERRDSITMELQENLFRFGLDIAKGMEYLAGKGIVHRRLAARNVLLTYLNEVKISGFGPQPTSDNDADAEKGKKERIPIKWVAPECMETTQDATEKSDVWSYAVVLWEIFSLGNTPYTGKGTDLPKRLKKGERLAKPEHCDDTWYATMKKCWSYEARKRPSFSDIRQELDNLFVAAPGDDYYFYQK